MAHAGFVYMGFLPERGGATHPAFQCCFGDRTLTATNGRAGIMTCVFVLVNSSNSAISPAACLQGEIFNKLKKTSSAMILEPSKHTLQQNHPIITSTL